MALVSPGTPAGSSGRWNSAAARKAGPSSPRPLPVRPAGEAVQAAGLQPADELLHLPTSRQGSTIKNIAC